MRIRFSLLLIFTGLLLSSNVISGIGNESNHNSPICAGITPTGTDVNLLAETSTAIPFEVDAKTYCHFRMYTPSTSQIFNWFIMTSGRYAQESHDLFAVDPVGSAVEVGGIDVIDCTIEFELAANSYYLVLLNNGTGQISINYEFSEMGTFPWRTVFEFQGTDQAAKVGFLKVDEMQLYKTTFSFSANRTFEYEILDDYNYKLKSYEQSYSQIEHGVKMSINGQVTLWAGPVRVFMDFQTVQPVLYEISIIHDYDTSGIVFLMVVGLIIGAEAIFHVYLKKRRNVGLIPYLKQKLKKQRPPAEISQPQNPPRTTMPLDDKI